MRADTGTGQLILNYMTHRIKVLAIGAEEKAKLIEVQYIKSPGTNIPWKEHERRLKNETKAAWRRKIKQDGGRM